MGRLPAGTGVVAFAGTAKLAAASINPGAAIRGVVLFDDRENAVEIVEVRHVAFEGFDIFADVLDRRIKFRLAASGYEDIGAFRDKTPRGREPDGLAMIRLASR